VALAVREGDTSSAGHGPSPARENNVVGMVVSPQDRLETNDNLWDVADLFELSSFPVALKFWRRSNETIATRRCVLFDEALGITPDRTICVDLLHTFHLGVLQEFTKLALWKLLSAGVWGALDGTLVECLRIAVLTLRSALWKWYEQRRTLFPLETLTRLADLVPTMLGKPSAKKLKTKAGETWGMALFVVDMLTAHAHRLGAEAPILREAGQCLLDYMATLRASSNVLQAPALQEPFTYTIFGFQMHDTSTTLSTH
jgi:hypothetical protein